MGAGDGFLGLRKSTMPVRLIIENNYSQDKSTYGYDEI